MKLLVNTLGHFAVFIFSNLQEDDTDVGKYWDVDSGSCAKCKKWTYEKKNCSSQNAKTKSYDCHQHGDDAYDKKCMKKEIVPGR